MYYQPFMETFNVSVIALQMTFEHSDLQRHREWVQVNSDMGLSQAYLHIQM